MADRLSTDWSLPEFAQLEQAWAAHPAHDLLRELVSERDPAGRKTWEIVKAPEADDPTWTAQHLRPLDPTDPRPAVRITRYPQHVMDELSAALAAGAPPRETARLGRLAGPESG